MPVVSNIKLKLLGVAMLNFCIRAVCLLTASLMAAHALSQDISGWSDKTVCRLLLSKPDMLVYSEEAASRNLVCGSTQEKVSRLSPDTGPVNFKAREAELLDKNIPIRSQCYASVAGPSPKEYVETNNVYGGNDRSFEDAGQALIGLSSSCFGSNDNTRKTCQKAKKYLLTMAENGWPKKETKNPTRDEGLEKYTINTYYLPQAAMLTATLDYKNYFTPSETQLLKKWLHSLATSYRKNHFNSKREKYLKQGHTSLRRAQNHYIASASAQMSVGAYINDQQLFDVGATQWRDTLNTMREDGSLPLETSRGSRAIWYTGLTLTKLMRLAEIARSEGFDLYDLPVKGKTYHDAVDFMLNASEKPSLIYKYAKYDYISGGDIPHTEQEYSPVSGGQYSWVAPYMVRFPDHPNTRRIIEYNSGEQQESRSIHLLTIIEASKPVSRSFTYLHLNSYCFIE